MDVRERPLHDWRLSLQPDLQDALAKALWHHRIDLWYGAHYVRFTQTDTGAETLLLRLEERARLIAADGTDPRLLTKAQLSARFIYEETLSLPRGAARAGAGRCSSGQQGIALGRRFFERAAQLLDECDEGG